jgi:hypothetical protein
MLSFFVILFRKFLRIFHRFQSLILFIFVLGLVDVMLYSDAVYAFLNAFLVMPEFLPIGIAVLVAVGAVIFVVRHIKKLKRKQ